MNAAKHDNLKPSSKKSPTKAEAALPEKWEEWCSRGRPCKRDKRRAVMLCRGTDGEIKGYYSDFKLNPDRDDSDSLYPSVDHTNGSKDHSKMVVETRIINDMKSHLSETEFWQIIEHLYAVGLEKNKITNSQPRKKTSWKPKKNY